MLFTISGRNLISLGEWSGNFISLGEWSGNFISLGKWSGNFISLGEWSGNFISLGEWSGNFYVPRSHVILDISGGPLKVIEASGNIQGNLDRYVSETSIKPSPPKWPPMHRWSFVLHRSVMKGHVEMYVKVSNALAYISEGVHLKLV